MIRAPTAGRPLRWRAALVALAVQLVIGGLVIRGLMAAQVITGFQRPRQPVQTYDVRVKPPEPTPAPTPEAKARAPEKNGAAAPAARKARATQIVAPKPAIKPPPPRVTTAPVAGAGIAPRSGGAAAGEGTGAGGAGNGTGSGTGGDGTGGGGGAGKPVKIAGDITAARDYPPDPEGTRLGRSVIIVLAVGADGKVAGCRVQKASGDAQADAATCRLATQRFRFRPATDAAGNPVASAYGWKQSWFRP